MFSSNNYLKRKTPAIGINRKEFIEHLLVWKRMYVIEAQEQVTANLANFAYDPLNWKYLNEAGSVKLFIELIGITNDNLQLHGTAGLCNICLDKEAEKVILEESNTTVIKELFAKTEKLDIILNILTLFYQLTDCLDASNKNLVITPEVIKRIEHLKKNKSDLRILNICSLILQDCAQKKLEI